MCACVTWGRAAGAASSRGSYPHNVGGEVVPPQQVGLAVQPHDEGRRAADEAVHHHLGDEGHVKVAPLERVQEEAEALVSPCEWMVVGRSDAWARSIWKASSSIVTRSHLAHDGEQREPLRDEQDLALEEQRQEDEHEVPRAQCLEEDLQLEVDLRGQGQRRAGLGQGMAEPRGRRGGVWGGGRCGVGAEVEALSLIDGAERDGDRALWELIGLIDG